MSGYIKVKVRSTGQVTEMVPEVARALINSGMAEKFPAESMAIDPAAAAERAVAPAQSGPAKKSILPRRR